MQRKALKAACQLAGAACNALVAGGVVRRRSAGEQGARAARMGRMRLHVPGIRSQPLGLLCWG